MRNKRIRIILDTNLWISFLITKKFAQLDKLINSEKLTLIFSQELINEFIDVAGRDKLKKYFTVQDFEKLLNLFDTYGLLINVKPNLKICRDYKDNFLLDLAVQANADYLITGDNDLLTLNNIGNTKIVSFRDFFNEVNYVN